MTELVEEKPNNSASKKTLLAIIFVSVLPVFAAYFMFFTGIGVPNNTVNSGKLIANPISLENLVDEKHWLTMSQEKKWRILLPIPERCNSSCKDNLYVTRQVHVRLSEKGSRVERYALNYSGDTGSQYLQSISKDHPLLKSVDVSKNTWKYWMDNIPELKSYTDTHFYFLVDQEGYAMMIYTDQHGNQLLKDIKRALKYSIDFQ